MTDNDCDANRAHIRAQTDAIRLDLSRFRHFGDEWQQICSTLLSCERLLTVMSNERNDISDDNKHDAVDRQQLRQIIKSIEPKKYSSKSYRRQSQTTRRSSYHRLKALTQLLMTSNLKRSTSLQSVPVVTTTDASDDTTATLPRLRRRPRINRFYHSLDVSDDNNECENTTKGDRSGLSLELSSSPSTQLLPTTGQTQKQLNRHSCDVSNLLLSPNSQSSSQNKQILKYSKKRLRGPYGEMLESMMNTKNNCEEDVKQSLSFIQELLKETEKQRKTLDGNAKETTGTKDVTTIETTPETTIEEKKSITATIGRHLDARTHIVGELYDTEKSFCEQLKDLIEKYSKPLNELNLIEINFVEIIFGKIPEILEIHSKFLESLRHRITSWSPEQTIGDLFSIFEEKNCFDSYLSFVDNWFESKQLIKQLSREKPLFMKFLMEASREHKSKLSLDELMISIIQRIPRFELLLKQLLKNTRESHPDFQLLNSALKKIHSLVLYINRVKNDVSVVSSHTSSLSSSNSTQIDLSHVLSINQLSDICDGLPNQVLINSNLYFIVSVLIRKRERILLLFSNILAIISIKGRKKSEKFEENKYKVLNYFFIDFLDLKENLEENEDIFEVLEKDFQIIQTIQTSFVTKLSQNSKHFLDSVLNELNQNLIKRMNELKSREKHLELIISDRTTQQTTEKTTENNSSISLTFLTQEKRQKFEQIFKELKSEKNNSKIIPEFICFLPIRKTRAGLQFTCASPTIGTNDVWICNSDGFVGQISVLSLNSTTNETTIEPTIVSSNGVCNSRIICMTCVPKSSQNESQSQSSEESEVSDSESDTTERSRRHLSPNRSSLSSATMWFGTDDSSVHIYSCFDAIRIKKNKLKVTLSARVESITYFSEKVFVSLANQSVAVFEREQINGNWNTLPVIRENLNCFRFCCVGQRLWTCGHYSRSITIRDSNLEPLFDDIIVSEMNFEDFITQMVSVDDSCRRVFISTHNSLSIHCFSSEQPFIYLSNISIQNTLNRALINCEDIIRQHKSACLRISSLLAVKDCVWIGTSAGIICILDSNQLDLEIVANGHTGHVRFLTLINNNLKKTIVISGGDGIELYRKIGLRELDNGRDDSTNHVILWTINE